MSRTGFAIKNTAAGVSSKVITLILSFVSRTIFIRLLGNEYLGINGLYSEVLSMLSFAELGFGSAMTFALYKPIAENDERTAARLTEYYKKVYRIVALVIAVLGVALLPFLQYIVKGADSVTLRELRLYYLIFLFNTVVGYFVTYKYSVV
ncbi:MAG: oligosaccharide flippase family protein, partial [Acutalibacteraceae bacterium]